MTAAAEPAAAAAARAAGVVAEDGHDRASERWLRVSQREFDNAAQGLVAAGARFVTVMLAEAPQRSLVAVFALRGDLVALRTELDGDPGAWLALGSWLPAARWAEQELLERLDPAGVDERGRRLTAPDPDVLDDHDLSGLDVFSIPYGPVRSGVFEAIQFAIESGGESVPRIQTRPFFKHRGLEKRLVGLAPDVAVHVAERVAGIAGVAHACAFSQAVERALGVVPPARAQAWRAVHAELERIACHLDVIAKQAETTALYVAQARFQILKERTMRIRQTLTGSRFGRGIVTPGGVRLQPTLGPDALAAELDAIDRDLRRDRKLFERTASMTDRLIGTGRLDRGLIEAYAAVGPVARGSGVSIDARHERPYDHYRRLGLRVDTERGGDAMARVRVRFRECSESLRILRQSVDHLRRRDGGLLAPPARVTTGAAFGWCESPQGELVVWVEIRDGRVHRAHIASPSLRNWMLFDHAFSSDVLTDFAFIEHSFGLTAAGADR